MVLKLNLDLLNTSSKNLLEVFCFRTVHTYELIPHIICTYPESIHILNIESSTIDSIWEGMYIYTFPFSVNNEGKNSLFIFTLYHSLNIENIYTKNTYKCTKLKLLQGTFGNANIPYWFLKYISTTSEIKELDILLSKIKEPITRIKFNDRSSYIHIYTANSTWIISDESNYLLVCKLNKLNKPEHLFSIKGNKVTSSNDLLKVHPNTNPINLLRMLKVQYSYFNKYSN